jgi:hypothetical protein
VAPAPLRVCFAVVSCCETQIWPEDLRVIVAGAVFFSFSFHDICRGIMEPRSFIMFLIGLIAHPNVRTEPQSEIGQQRKKIQNQ